MSASSSESDEYQFPERIWEMSQATAFMNFIYGLAVQYDFMYGHKPTMIIMGKKMRDLYDQMVYVQMEETFRMFPTLRTTLSRQNIKQSYQIRQFDLEIIMYLGDENRLQVCG